MESGRGSFEEDFNAANLASVPPYEPLQTVPLTLAPFVLAPNAASALPNINIATPDANKFPQLSIPDSGFVIADDQLEAIKSGITNVMNTSPVFMSTKLDDQILSSHLANSTSSQIFVPIPSKTPNTTTGHEESFGTSSMTTNEETNFDRLVSFTMDLSSTTPISSRTKEASSSSTTTATSPLDEDRSLNDISNSVLPFPLQLPGVMMQPMSSSSPAPQLEISGSMTSQTTEISESSSVLEDRLVEPNTNRKKRQRTSINYSDLDNGMATVSEPERSPQVKRPKTVVSASPPAVVSVPMTGAGATRRFGARMHALLLWFDFARDESDSKTKSQYPSLLDLCDICTDLHTINLSEDFTEAQQIVKFVASLRLIHKMALNEPFTKECLNPSSAESKYASVAHLSMLATVCMLFLLAHPTFDRKYLSDECLDESCQTIVHVLSGFVYAVIDDSNVNARPMDIEFDVEALLKPKKVNTRRVLKKKQISPSWQQGPFATVTAQLITLIYESLNHLSQLMGASNLPDEHILRLLRICRLTVFAHNLHALQDISLKIMRKLFVQYPAYRQSMLQDVFEAIGDLANGNKNPLDLEYGNFHLVTHVVLQLLQANSDHLNLSENNDEKKSMNAASSASAAASSTSMTLSSSSNGLSSKFRAPFLSRFFVKTLLDSLVERFEAKEDAYVVVSDRMVHDLLMAIFRPEWPASEMLLRDFLQHILQILHQSQGSTRGGAGGGGAAGEDHLHLHERAKLTLGTWLSLIGTKLVSSKLYMTTANLMKRPQPGDVETRLLQEGSKCSLCTQYYSGKKMASCTRCLRWFHVECFSITFAPHDSHSDWLCDACLVGFVYDMISDAKSMEETLPAAVPNSTAQSKRRGSKKQSISRPSIDEELQRAQKDAYNRETMKDEDLDPQSNKEDGLGEDGVLMNRMHFAMKILTLNYLNEVQNELTLDAKRYLLRNWILEHENGEVVEEALFREQWAPTTINPFIHLPLGPFRPTREQLDANMYMRILQNIGTLNKAQISENQKTGLLPSGLALQIFATRFSLSSNTSLSIFAYFPKIIDQFVAMMNSEQAKTRALALRAITNMVDADMSLLREKHLYEAVEARLIDPSPLTREKALNMLGRFIIMNPSVVSQYAPLIRDRVEDSSVSVRKRAVRIIRSVCLLLPGSHHVVSFCSALAKRIVRHGESIKEMTLALFREIWFTADDGKKALLDQAKADLMDPELPKADLSVSMTIDDGASTSSANAANAASPGVDPETEPLATHEKVNQILAILKETLRFDPEHDIAWFVDLLGSMKSVSKNQILDDFVQFLVDFLSGTGEEADLEFERQKQCDALVVQHQNNPAMKRAAIAAAAQNKEDLIRKRLLYSMALYYVAQAIPHSVCDHFHQLRMMLSVEAPTPSTHSLEKKTMETVLGTLEMIIPFIRHPSEDIWTALLKDLSQVMKSHGMPVIAASVKCGAAIARRTNSNWIKSLYVALANPLKAELASSSYSLSKNETKTTSKTTPTTTTTNNGLHSQTIIRFLFTLSMILKSYPLDPPSQIREKDLATVDSIRAYRYGPHVEEVYRFIVHFWKSEDRDVKTSAVLSLGHLAPGSPGIFVRPISEEIIAAALSPSSLEQLKAQGLKTIHEFLSEEADRMKAAAEGPSSSSSSSLPSSSSSSSALASSSASAAKNRRSSSSSSSQATRSASAAKKSNATPSNSAKHSRRASVNSTGSQSDEFEEGDSFDDPDAFNGGITPSPSSKPRKNGAKSFSSASDMDEMMDVDVTENSPIRKQFGLSRTVSTTDTGLSSTIVEIYIKRILSLGVDKSVTIRNAALALIEQILRMGLTHPAYCVPTLVALETDDALGELAHRCLSRLDTTRVLNRIAIGIQSSFHFQKTLYRVPKAVRPISLEGGVTNYQSTLGRLYALFAEAGRVNRNNFLSAAFGLYEAHSDNKTPFDAMFITYLTLLIAQFPFTTQEEALYAIYQSNRYIASLATSSLNRLKQFYKSIEQGQSSKKGSTSSSASASCPSESDMQDAIVAWHLLMLKVFFRSFYGLDSERCRNFMPSDTHATPVANSATTVNAQEWLHTIYTSFEGFLVETDWSKRPDVCKRIFENLKQAIKTQEDDVAKPHGRAKRNSSVAAAAASSYAQHADGSTANYGDDLVSPSKPKSKAKPRTKSSAAASKSKRRKSTSHYDSDGSD